MGTEAPDTPDDVNGRENDLRRQMIAEPVMGEGGIFPPLKEYFEITSSIIHNRGGLFIADEVQSGFGRTGTMFAVEQYGDADTDIMVMAKGIAAGFPISAFTSGEKISEVMKPGDHLSTFGGNPVSAAASVANIHVLQDEKIVENSAARGKQLLSSLTALKEKYPLIGDVRGKGLMIGIELVRDKKTKEPAESETARVRGELRKAGVLVGKGGVYGNVIRIQPPLVIDEEQCGRVAEAVEAVLRNFSWKEIRN